MNVNINLIKFLNVNSRRIINVHQLNVFLLLKAFDSYGISHTERNMKEKTEGKKTKKKAEGILLVL